MTLPLYFDAATASCTTGDLVELDPAEAHHAATVKRARVGEHLQLTDGAGAWATATVENLARARLTVRVVETGHQSQPVPRVSVAQAIPKGARAELAVELMTEVGVDAIIPWAADRCVARWDADKSVTGHRKWQDAASAAAKQSRRLWWPSVAAMATTADLVDLVTTADLALVLHEDASALLTATITPDAGSVLLVVGPEGGITDAELQALTGAGAHAVRLGSEVLRTSTAGAAAAAALFSRTRWAS